MELSFWVTNAASWWEPLLVVVVVVVLLWDILNCLVVCPHPFLSLLFFGFEFFLFVFYWKNHYVMDDVIA